MISISTQEQSEYFAILKDVPGSLSGAKKRRVSVIATLDGGSVVNDSGYSDTDRTIKIELQIDAEKYAIVDYMVENYRLWNVVVGGEYLSCNPMGLTLPKNNRCKLTLAITE